MDIQSTAKDGRTVAIVELLDRGADIETRDQWQQTPLHWAAGNGHADTSGVLLDRGADICARNQDGKMPLHEAAQYGRTDTVGLLVHRGADVNARDKDGNTPLDLAVANGHTETAALLAKIVTHQKYQAEIIALKQRIAELEMVPKAVAPAPTAPVRRRSMVWPPAA